MAGDPGDAPEVGGGGIRSVLTTASLVAPSGDEVRTKSLPASARLHSFCICFAGHSTSILCTFSANSDLALE